MNAVMEVNGEDVLGLPGQTLTREELSTLVGLADGTPTVKLAQQLGVDEFTVGQIERAIQRKLGARNRLHMITRGFTLGVLVPRALCLLLCVTSALEIDHDLFRQRFQRRPRTNNEVVRILRISPNSSAGNAPLYG
ncbi:LuxR C-terminal-related transcriptional regulator [Pseudomonas putida]|uniref:LuxR C-terminal-related transcriptional regulator n=1 Tax=Pseudomonas putida TaxID=303 RepID=UPI00370C20C0